VPRLPDHPESHYQAVPRLPLLPDIPDIADSRVNQDTNGRRLRRFERRWLVERFFTRVQWQRRLLVRRVLRRELSRFRAARKHRYPVKTILDR
jgi:hypothetical protein